jgi:hypothetical protein
MTLDNQNCGRHRAIFAGSIKFEQIAIECDCRRFTALPAIPAA